MTGNKTKPTNEDVGAFIASVEPKTRKADAETLLGLMKRTTGMKPVMWGDSIVGFGRYRYKNRSGRAGEFFLTGFSPRKSAMTVYVMPGFKAYGDLLAKLGKHRHSVSCLYITRLANIELSVLETIIADSVERMKANYPGWSPA